MWHLLHDWARTWLRGLWELFCWTFVTSSGDALCISVIIYLSARAYFSHSIAFSTALVHFVVVDDQSMAVNWVFLDIRCLICWRTLSRSDLIYSFDRRTLSALVLSALAWLSLGTSEMSALLFNMYHSWGGRGVTPISSEHNWLPICSVFSVIRAIYTSMSLMFSWFMWCAILCYLWILRRLLYQSWFITAFRWARCFASPNLFFSGESAGVSGRRFLRCDCT